MPGKAEGADGLTPVKDDDSVFLRSALDSHGYVSAKPAFVLLERIRAEKENHIKQCKIKRDKKEPIIFKGSYLYGMARMDKT